MIRSSFLATVMLGCAAAVAYPTERDRICHPGYAASLRLHGAAYDQMRDKAFAAAGIPVALQCHKHDPRPDCRILDHIIPLELIRPSKASHANDPENLQVQPRAEAEAKDAVEDETRRLYCSGRITIEDADARFSRSRR
jgi:hypothetical protein